MVLRQERHLERLSVARFLRTTTRDLRTLGRFYLPDLNDEQIIEYRDFSLTCVRDIILHPTEIPESFYFDPMNSMIFTRMADALQHHLVDCGRTGRRYDPRSIIESKTVRKDWHLYFVDVQDMMTFKLTFGDRLREESISS